MIVVYMAKMIALTATIYTDPLSSSRHSEFIQNNGAKQKNTIYMTRLR